MHILTLLSLPIVAQFVVLAALTEYNGKFHTLASIVRIPKARAVTAVVDGVMTPLVWATCHKHNLNMDEAWNCVHFLKTNRGHEDCRVEKGGWTSMCRAGSVEIVGAVVDWTTPYEQVPCMFVGASIEVVLERCGAKGGMSEDNQFQETNG